jgi:hypothetical protein
MIRLLGVFGIFQIVKGIHNSPKGSHIVVQAGVSGGRQFHLVFKFGGQLIARVQVY